MRTDLTPELLNRLYIDEQKSIGQIAGITGYEHRAVKRRLKDFGIRQRTPSEQKMVDLSKMSYEKRMAMTAASRAIITGKKRSHEDLCKRASGKQRNAALSGDEALIMDALIASGLNPIPLYAIDKFNIDFAFVESKLAVEYHGGNWHNTAAKKAQDARKATFLRSAGWDLIVFPRIDKPQANNAGNRMIQISEIVDTIQRHLKHPQQDRLPEKTQSCSLDERPWSGDAFLTMRR